MRKLMLFTAVAAAALASAAHAQQTYPTAASGVRVQGTVPLQCNSSGASCAPVTLSNPAQVQIGNGAGTAVNVTASFADTLNPNDVGIQSNSRNYVYDPGNTAWQRQRGDLNGTVVQSALSSTYWRYTSGTAPILSNTTTAVTMKAAAGAGVRNYVSSCQITTTAFGASVPLAIRDGAGGTVMFALTVPTAGFLQPTVINFNPPLQGTANTLVEIVTTTANVSGTVTANCQGWTGI